MKKSIALVNLYYYKLTSKYEEIYRFGKSILLQIPYQYNMISQ